MIEQSVGTSIMSERFTETLRAASEPDWSHAVRHLFVEELFAGAVPDAVMARSGLYGGSSNNVILLGTTSPWLRCQPAPSRITTAWASAATWLLISQR